MATVTLRHPDSDVEIETSPDAVRPYLSQGWHEVTGDAPKGNASLAEWQDYARSKGLSDTEIQSMTRSDLRAALA